MNETDLQRQVMDWLLASGVFCWRQNNGGVFDPVRKKFRRLSKYAKAGIPDIVGILPDGRFLGIELKRPPDGKRRPGTLENMLSDNQKDFIRDASNLGALCFVADSLETVKEKLKAPISRF